MKNIAIFKKYKDYIFFTTRIQLFSRYSNMYLGIMWSFIDPLLFMGIYSFIYLVLFNFSTQYYLSFLMTGLIIWGWMSSVLIQGTGSISSKIGMSEQVAIPKQIFPLVDLLIQSILSGIAFVLIFIMMIYEGGTFHMAYLGDYSSHPGRFGGSFRCQSHPSAFRSVHRRPQTSS